MNHRSPSATLLNKCTHVEIAVSGDASNGRDWMLIVPYRVDATQGNKKCYDIDPTSSFWIPTLGRPTLQV